MTFKQYSSTYISYSVSIPPPSTISLQFAHGGKRGDQAAMATREPEQSLVFALQCLEGKIVTVELRNEMVVTGRLDTVDPQMKCVASMML